MTRAQRPRILIVDDDAVLRRTLCRVVAAQFDVTEASNGAEAILLLGREKFDAILTDLEMPELGGDGLVKWLEQNDPELAKRAIVVTGGAKRRDQSEWLSAFDPSRVLRKPCSIEDVLAALDRILGGGS
ncbi:MAG TPA: response regulator [Polyangiaceae bacterium]|jgi:CheY-like chemotaxis protein